MKENGRERKIYKFPTIASTIHGIFGSPHFFFPNSGHLSTSSTVPGTDEDEIDGPNGTGIIITGELSSLDLPLSFSTRSVECRWSYYQSCYSYCIHVPICPLPSVASICMHLSTDCLTYVFTWLLTDF